MNEPNPYESPGEANNAREDRSFGRYLPLLSCGLAAGLVLTWFAPMTGIAVTLLAMPAMVRATRIYWRKALASANVRWIDWCSLFAASTAAVIPVAFVGYVAFCCVCTASGFVVVQATNPNLHYGNDSWLYLPVSLGVASALIASLLLLRRFKYLSSIEATALREETGQLDHPNATTHEAS